MICARLLDPLLRQRNRTVFGDLAAPKRPLKVRRILTVVATRWSFVIVAS